MENDLDLSETTKSCIISCDVVEAMKGWRMSCDVGEATERFKNEL